MLVPHSGRREKGAEHDATCCPERQWQHVAEGPRERTSRVSASTAGQCASGTMRQVRHRSHCTHCQEQPPAHVTPGMAQVSPQRANRSTVSIQRLPQTLCAQQ